MKSLNVKKVAAAAAGMAFLGAAFASAAVQVDSAGLGSFQFFNNGEPAVKVVVGQNAAASDAVAAGNIAAMIGNLAYKDQMVTVLGQNLLSCGGATGGAGSCDLSNKKVVLTVTTPGINPASAFSMKTYVEDNLDYNADQIRGTSTSFGSTTTGFAANTGAKVVNKDLTAVLAPHPDLASDGKIAYGKGSTNTKEEQKVYLFAYTSYDTADELLLAKDAKTGYEAIFQDPIPICLDTSKNASSGCSDSDKVSKNNVRITFLGQKWSIMDYTLASSGDLVTSVTLGKEIQHKDIMRVGDSATTTDGYTIKLVDLSGFGYGTSGTSLPRVSFSVEDANGNLLKQITVDEGSGSTTISEANNLVIKVNKAFPGAFAKEAYADVSLFSNKLDLTNNQEISGAPGGSKGWKVVLTNGWVGTSSGIAKIQLYNDVDQTYKTPVSQNLKAGESIDLIRNLPGLKFNFLGLESVDYDSLTMTVQKDRSLPYWHYTAGLPGAHSVKGDFLLITSTKSNAFQYAKNVDNAYVLLSSTNTSVPVYRGQVFYYDENLNYYISNTSASGGYLGMNGSSGGLTYTYSSSENAVLAINTSLQGAGGAAPAGNMTVIAIPELTEDANGTSASIANNNYHWNVLYDANLRQFVDGMAATTAGKVGYDDVSVFTGTNATLSLGAKEAGYISRRGGVFNSLSSSSASFSYPTTLAHAAYTLTASGTSASANDADYTLSEGDSKDLGGGYKIKVKSITADAAAAETESGAPAGLSGLENLKPSVEKAAVVTELSASSPLVVFDTEASDTANLIVVGGPAINSLAARAGVTMSAGADPVIKVMGSKVIVAGYTAADTQAAARELISWLGSQRASIRG